MTKVAQALDADATVDGREVPNGRLTWITGVPKSGTTAVYATTLKAQPDAVTFLEPSPVEYPAIESLANEGQLDIVIKIVLGAKPPPEWLISASSIMATLRDPRDVVVSWLPFRAVANPRSFALTGLREDLMDAFRRKAEGDTSIDVTAIEAIYRSHGSRALDPQEYAAAFETLDQVRRHPATRLIRYEDFVAGRIDGLRSVALTGDIARNHRGGRTGEWMKWFSTRDIERFRTAFDPLLQRYGYADWEARQGELEIDGSEYEGYLRRVSAERGALYAQAAEWKARYAPRAKRLFGGLKSQGAYENPAYVEKLKERARSGRLGAIREIVSAVSKGWLERDAEIERFTIINYHAESAKADSAQETNDE
ncbi:sulfotransferase domain-containing protein [Brevundimonas lutea]|uniref:sulfotransferase domain-containing protein n=1 Tax=Brevundimonas lutea TaxID=2293980 RepID=UPI0013CE8F78|nr:sulfotransferase domain-containing protein [Brevundimonas lutea]